MRGHFEEAGDQEDRRHRQAQNQTQPHAYGAHFKAKGKQITNRDPDHPIGNANQDCRRFYILNPTQQSGPDGLRAVGDLEYGCKEQQERG